MSKKLIAVASAAALALAALVAVPASATTITSVEIVDSAGVTANAASHSSSTSAVVAATSMTSRTLDFNSTSSTTRNVVRFVVTAASATTISVSSTGSVKLSADVNDADGAALSITTGGTSLSKAVITGSLSYTFYAYNTSTTAGTVVIETPGSKNTYYVKGVATLAYNLVGVTFPSSILSGETAGNTNKNVVYFQITDAYGNSVTSGATATLAGTGGTFSGAAVYSSTRKRWEANVSGTTEANVAMSVTLTTTDLSANGFAEPVDYAYSSVSAGSLAAQVTALTAQVAALKADYNALAAKWNKRVASKTAPKKAVATK